MDGACLEISGHRPFCFVECSEFGLYSPLIRQSLLKGRSQLNKARAREWSIVPKEPFSAIETPCNRYRMSFSVAESLESVSPLLTRSEPISYLQVSLLEEESSLDRTSLSGYDNISINRSIWSISSITVVLLGFLGLVEYSIVMPSLNEV